MIRGQLKIEDYEDPFSLFVLPRYYEGKPVFEVLQIVALKISAEKDTFTSDELREYVPPGKNKNVVGAVIGALKRKGYIEPVGVTKTGVPSSHGRAILIYRITEEGRRYLNEVVSE